MGPAVNREKDIVNIVLKNNFTSNILQNADRVQLTIWGDSNDVFRQHPAVQSNTEQSM